MDIRMIEHDDITQRVADAFLKLNYTISKDIENALRKALICEKSPIGCNVLEQIILNNKIASEQSVPLCQDTGMAVLFVEYGDHVHVNGGNISTAIEQGVRQAFSKGYLRKSIVSDPVFQRLNTKDNTPAIVYTDIVSGDKISILAGVKGFGSENMSAIKMMVPSDGVKEIKQFVLETVENAGPNPCPPIVVGVGIGGTFDKAAQLAKKATFRSIETCHPDSRYALLEQEILSQINCLGIGPAGLGGITTALGVNIETFPTHIAGMPVAVNISCHASRHMHIVL